MFSIPDMPVGSYLLQGSLTCFYVTVRSSGLKSYWVTSEIAFSVRTLVGRSSNPSYFSFAYRKWGTRLKNYDQFIPRSGRLRAKIVLNFLWRPHLNNAGCLLGENRDIFLLYWRVVCGARTLCPLIVGGGNVIKSEIVWPLLSLILLKSVLSLPVRPIMLCGLGMPCMPLGL